MIQASPGVLRQRSTRRSQRPVPGTLVGGNPHAGHSSLVIVISSDTLRGGEVKRSAAASDQPPPRALPHPHVGNPACHGSWLASGSGLQFPSPHKSRARVDASAGPKPQPSHTTAPSPSPLPSSDARGLGPRGVGGVVIPAGAHPEDGDGGHNARLQRRLPVQRLERKQLGGKVQQGNAKGSQRGAIDGRHAWVACADEAQHA